MIPLTEQQKSEGWCIVKFGDIAQSVSKRIDPSETELEVYVGLGHLDPNNLRITRRGIPSDVTGQKLLVKPGQIIFGKRRAYQRKVAVADFEGICSAHAMVLEAIPETVIPEYLPFFIQSDMFMERAVAISEGSLSPTIKWKTLASQEFPLPPRGRQGEALGIFEKIEQTLFEYDQVINKGHLFLEKSIYSSIFERNNGGIGVPLSSLVEEIREHFRPNKTLLEELSYVGYEHIDSDSIQIKKYGSSSDVHSNKLFFQKGDILYGKIRPYLKKTALADFEGVCSSDIIVLRPVDENLSNLISLTIKSDYFANLAMTTASGSKMPRANWKILEKTRINQFTLEDEKFNRCMKNTVEVIRRSKINKDKNMYLKKKFTEEFFGRAGGTA
ncbi:MAG: restriction endonuclease subunit S [Gammaproteobacteria bacterium]|nr:restriction endonuclease subunit S [Gammaproteobacteria bacterium]